MIGAGIGPGGDSQYLGGDVFTRWGRVGGFIGRQVYDNDAFYATIADTVANRPFQQHWVGLQAGVRALVRRGPLEFSGDLGVEKQLNRYYLLENDVWNVNVVLAGRWRPGRPD